MRHLTSDIRIHECNRLYQYTCIQSVPIHIYTCHPRCIRLVLLLGLRVIHKHTHTRTHTHIPAHKYTHKHTRVCRCAFIHTRINRMGLHIYTYIYIPYRTRSPLLWLSVAVLYVCIYTNIHTYMHTHIHTSSDSLSSSGSGSGYSPLRSAL